MNDFMLFAFFSVIFTCMGFIAGHQVGVASVVKNLHRAGILDYERGRGFIRYWLKENIRVG